MLPAEYADRAPQLSKNVGSGPATINLLRRACLTGYVGVAEAASDLLRVAETAWLKQLSAYFLGNDRPGSDFFIQRASSKPISKQRVSKRNLPEFLSRQTALSILHVGKAARYLNDEDRDSLGGVVGGRCTYNSPTANMIDRVKVLSDLRSPLSKDAFDDAVMSIRSSLAHQLAIVVLPSSKVIDTMHNLQNLLLLRRVNFADALITEAGKHLRNRHLQTQTQAKGSADHSLAGVTMREGELTSVLSRALAAVSGYISTEQLADLDIEWARENITLHMANTSKDYEEDDQQEDDAEPPTDEPDADKFNDFLLATPTVLSLRLRPPLDLIIINSDVRIYEAMSSYLFSVRRAHLHLTELWRQASLRKGAASSAGPDSSYKSRMFLSDKLRKKFSIREQSMRSTWATCNRTTCLLLELGEYLISRVVGCSWDVFEKWARGDPPSDTQPPADDGNVPLDSTSHVGNARPEDTADSITDTNNGPSDPEVLAQAHRQYLFALSNDLLLNHTSYTKALRSLLLRIDQLVALIQRLQSIQHKLDLADEGVDDGFSDKYIREEQEVKAELETARERVEGANVHLVETLREADNERKSGRLGQVVSSETGFEPWAGASIDHLLMRLDLSTDAQAA